MSLNGIEYLTTEIWRVLDYAAVEYDLNVSEVVGVLEVLKHDYIVSIDDEDKDKDEDKE